MSPRPGGSILVTSAPSHASSCVHDGPDWTRVMSTTRTPDRAFESMCFGPPLLVHGLVHGPWRECLGVHPDVDERRLAGRARSLERGPDVLRVADGFAVS